MPKVLPNGLLIKQIHERLEKTANNALRPRDLTMTQVAVLMTIQESAEKRLSMKEIERHFQVAQSTVVGIVARLEQKGLAEAFGDASDKRVKLVHITPAGEACCRESASDMEETERQILRGFTPEEREQLHTLLSRALANLD